MAFSPVMVWQNADDVVKGRVLESPVVLAVLFVDLLLVSEWECELAGQIWFVAEFLSDMLFGTKFCPSTCMTVYSGQ